MPSPWLAQLRRPQPNHAALIAAHFSPVQLTSPHSQSNQQSVLFSLLPSHNQKTRRLRQGHTYIADMHNMYTRHRQQTSTGWQTARLTLFTLRAHLTLSWDLLWSQNHSLPSLYLTPSHTEREISSIAVRRPLLSCLILLIKRWLIFPGFGTWWIDSSLLSLSVDSFPRQLFLSHRLFLCCLFCTGIPSLFPPFETRYLTTYHLFIFSPFSVHMRTLFTVCTSFASYEFQTETTLWLVALTLTSLR